MIDLAKWVLSELSDFYDMNRPDLVVYDQFCFAARILAHRLALPAVQIYSGCAHYKRFYIRENGVCLTPSSLLDVGSEIDSFLSHYGVKGGDSLWHTEKLNIHFIPKEFQHHADYFDERFCFVGACLNRDFIPTWKDNSGGSPIILVSNTTLMEDAQYFKSIIDAFSGSEFHVILSICGYNITDESLGTLPRNFEINRHASHLEILPHAALAICQGGTGNTLEPVYYGIPVVAVPYTPFHEEIAYRIGELGLGVCLPGNELSVRSLRHSVSQVVGNPAIIEAIARMRRAFSSAGGAKRAVDRIEEFLRAAPREPKAA